MNGHSIQGFLRHLCLSFGRFCTVELHNQDCMIKSLAYPLPYSLYIREHGGFSLNLNRAHTTDTPVCFCCCCLCDNP